MNKLTPFDAECIRMVADITQVEPHVEQKADYYTIGVMLGTVPDETIKALTGAIAGRLGERMKMHGTQDDVLTFTVKYAADAEKLPDQIEYDQREIDPSAGMRCCRTLKEITAIQVDREKLEELQRFTGGGTMTIPRIPGGIAMYSFTTPDGLIIDTPETWYIIREDNGKFSHRPKREFDAEFEPKGCHVAGNYGTGNHCGECSNMRHEDFAGVGYCDTIKDNTTCDQKACGHYEPKK